MPDDDEKDRLGDTLHKKKRGDEEQYFAQLERLRIARLRERAAAGSPSPACPRCGRTLVPAGRPPAGDECDGGCTPR